MFKDKLIQCITFALQVQNLVEGTTYEFRVTAENKAGRSQPSPVSDPVVIREPVGKFLLILFFKPSSNENKCMVEGGYACLRNHDTRTILNLK